MINSESPPETFKPGASTERHEWSISSNSGSWSACRRGDTWQQSPRSNPALPIPATPTAISVQTLSAGAVVTQLCNSRAGSFRLEARSWKADYQLMSHKSYGKLLKLLISQQRKLLSRTGQSRENPFCERIFSIPNLECNLNLRNFSRILQILRISLKSSKRNLAKCWIAQNTSSCSILTEILHF